MTPRKSDYLLSTQAVRERSLKIFELTEKGQGLFSYQPERWNHVVQFTVETIREKYPDLNIPFHSRLGHFRPGGVDRLSWPEFDLSQKSPIQKLQTLVDLIVPSVLLDAGAGMAWRYQESKTGQTLSRSEGLGVASLHMFLQGKFSSSGKTVSDAGGLMKISDSDIELGFQVNEKNPLVGVSGRTGLLRALGQTILENPSAFPANRPSDLINQFVDGQNAFADKTLAAVLKYLGPIWPSRLSYEGIPLGDTWHHPGLGPVGSFESFVPFHKLSQWLTYSLLDACQLCGFKVINVDRLTGLPEYRNGGLFVDLGLILPKDKKYFDLGVTPEMPFTIEWRALTICLLDQIAEKIRGQMGLTLDQFPLAKVLEGGTWWAGRKVAASKRADGGSPIKVILDGTVF